MKFRNFNKINFNDIEIEKLVENSKQSSRILFKKGKQKEFLRKYKEKMKIKWIEFEDIIKVCGYSPGSLRVWRAEICNMPFSVTSFISKISEIKIPDNVEIRDKNWGRKLGGKNFLLKYGKKRFVIMGNRGRRKSKKLYGKNAMALFASKGGRIASKNRLGIFSVTNEKARTEWRMTAFKKKIGIFDKKYSDQKNKWRLKGLLNSPKLSIKTNLGINVRSRDEKQIIEKLYEWGFFVIYESRQVMSRNNQWILPDFGFEDNKEIFIEYFGRSDKSYLDYKLPRWKSVLKETSSEFIFVVRDKKKFSGFSDLENVIIILEFGEWEKLKDILSQLHLKRKQPRFP